MLHKPDDAGETIMIALLPSHSEWSKSDLPHLTLVFAGLIKDHKPTDFNELAKDAAMIAALSAPVRLMVSHRDTMGKPGKEVDAFLLRHSTQLLAMRRAVERWNKSEFPYSPHVTIGPVGTYVESVPKWIHFDRILVAWGDEHLTFWLRG